MAGWSGAEGARGSLPLTGDARPPWQKGQVSRLLVVHLAGGTTYKTNIQTFTVSVGRPGSFP